MKTSYTEIEGKQRWFSGLLFTLVYLVLIRTIEWRQLLSSSDLYPQLGVGVALAVGTCGLMLRYARDVALRYKVFLLLLAVQIGLFAILSFLLGLQFFDMLLLAMLLIEPMAGVPTVSEMVGRSANRLPIIFRPTRGTPGMKAAWSLTKVVLIGTAVMGGVCLLAAHAFSRLNENPAEAVVLVIALFVVGNVLGKVADRAKRRAKDNGETL